MVFTNAANKAVTITVPSVKETVTAAEIKAAMNTILTHNIFSTSGGVLASLKAASVVSTDTQDVTIS